MKILIVKTSSLGDIIHSYSVLSYLRTHFPKAEIDFVVEKPFAELVLNHPFVNHVIQIDTKIWRKSVLALWRGMIATRREIRLKQYDVCFDLQGNLKSGLIVSQVKAKKKVGFGFKTAAEWPNCFFQHTRFDPPKICNVREENLILVEQYFKKPAIDESVIELKISDDEKRQLDSLLPKSAKPKVMVCPGSMWKNKQLPKQVMKAFLMKLQPHLNCHFIFVFGSLQEKEYVEELARQFPNDATVLDKLSLSCLQNLMDKMQLVVAMDSLPLHLAGTTKTKTFSFFGPSSSLKYKPIGNQHQAFQGTCPYERSIIRRCPILRTCKTGACLREVDADILFNAFLSYKDSYRV